MGLLDEHGGGGSKRRRASWVFVVLAAAVAGALAWSLLVPPQAEQPGRAEGPPATDPPAAPAPAAPSPAATGTIEVTANLDGATVRVDGRVLGPAPRRVDGVSAGSHRVRVEKDGFPPFDRDVHVVPGRSVSVEARLQPPAPRLLIDSDVAGATVFVDRKLVGTTPVELYDVKAGTHRLNLTAEGYEMHGEDLVVTGERQDVFVRFKEVRLDAAVEVVHKHGFGSCEGRLVADAAGLRYETSKTDYAFRVPLSAIELLEVEYLKKTLKLRVLEIQLGRLSQDAVEEGEHLGVRIGAAAEEDHPRARGLEESEEARVVEVCGDDLLLEVWDRLRRHRHVDQELQPASSMVSSSARLTA